MRVRSIFSAASALALLVTAVPSLAATAYEQAQLALVLKQLGHIDALAKAAATSEPARRGERYRFDYQRLEADIQRIRQGVRGYLSPSRAQPRDVGELSGGYLRERDTGEHER